MDLKGKFINAFGGDEDGIRCFHAPGRVNIIGEHVDYNGGYVLPCAINFGTYALIRKRGDSTARFASTNFDDVVEISLDNVVYDDAHGWANYPKGIVHFLQKHGHSFSGFDVLFSGNIPNGAGLSSSASIELAMAVALNNVFSLGVEMIDLVKIAQQSENHFCGVNCGIMDMFAVGMGKEGFALYLHCDTLEFEYVPLDLGDYAIVIMDTNKRRKLNESKYNERRAECEKAKRFLSLAPEDFRKEQIKDETIRKRARHVIYENERVRQAVKAMKNSDLPALGKLLNESHASLRDDYEVSCKELDTVVELAQSSPACIGARMTGAGFGGCAIALVKQSEAESFSQKIISDYEKIIGFPPAIFVQKSGDGAREIFS